MCELYTKKESPIKSSYRWYNEPVKSAIEANKDFICNEVLAKEIAFGKLDPSKALDAELEEGATFIGLVKF